MQQQAGGSDGEWRQDIMFCNPRSNKKEPELCKKWLHAIGTDKFNPTTHVYHQDRVVCETHFTKECFEEDMIATIMGTTRKRKKLKPGAVPTIFSFRDGPKSRPATQKEIQTKQRKK
ncbi:THAP domain-containing protein 3 [Holothuria leucospilota]|uniref:THAP domain-containing protein 3 n=1 Tax=Holothuria leucospilota TaxID=206669 RepID=A0A9Q1CT94_HOLLE|nr:THAP domain-containing protein 3 [Holothuria leucospilota]